jgi:hypothetical protein
VVVGEALWFVAMGHTPEVAAVGYAHTSHGIGPVATPGGCLPLYLHYQPIYLPSLTGQSSDILCIYPLLHADPHPPPRPPTPPHLLPVYLALLRHPPYHYRHIPYAHR